MGKKDQKQLEMKKAQRFETFVTLKQLSEKLAVTFKQFDFQDAVSIGMSSEAALSLEIIFISYLYLSMGFNPKDSLDLQFRHIIRLNPIYLGAETLYWLPKTGLEILSAILIYQYSKNVHHAKRKVQVDQEVLNFIRNSDKLARSEKELLEDVFFLPADERHVDEFIGNEIAVTKRSRTQDDIERRLYQEVVKNKKLNKVKALEISTELSEKLEKLAINESFFNVWGILELLITMLAVKYTISIMPTLIVPLFGLCVFPRVIFGSTVYRRFQDTRAASNANKQLAFLLEVLKQTGLEGDTVTHLKIGNESYFSIFFSSYPKDAGYIEYLVQQGAVLKAGIFAQCVKEFFKTDQIESFNNYVKVPCSILSNEAAKTKLFTAYRARLESYKDIYTTLQLSLPLLNSIAGAKCSISSYLLPDANDHNLYGFKVVINLSDDFNEIQDYMESKNVPYKMAQVFGYLAIDAQITTRDEALDFYKNIEGLKSIFDEKWTSSNIVSDMGSSSSDSSITDDTDIFKRAAVRRAGKNSIVNDTPNDDKASSPVVSQKNVSVINLGRGLFSNSAQVKPVSNSFTLPDGHAHRFVKLPKSSGKKNSPLTDEVIANIEAHCEIISKNSGGVAGFKQVSKANELKGLKVESAVPTNAKISNYYRAKLLGNDGKNRYVFWAELVTSDTGCQHEVLHYLGYVPK